MKIKISFNTSILKYRSPVSIFGKLISENTFLHVKMTDPILKDFYFSLLPGLHNSQLNEVEFILKNLFSEECVLNLPDLKMDKRFFGLFKTDLFINNEILFIIETILLGVLEIKDDSKVKINQVYSAYNSLEYYQNAECLKIKFSPQDQTSKTIDLILKLEKLNPQMFIRLDGNRKFSLDKLVQFSHELEQSLSYDHLEKIDYFEEPLTNFYDSLVFEKCSNIPIAIDESFIEYFKFNKTSPLSTSICIIKPSLYGISPIVNWMNTHPHSRCIISSSYEHPSVMPALNFLARKRPHEYHGLENFFN